MTSAHKALNQRLREIDEETRKDNRTARKEALQDDGTCGDSWNKNYQYLMTPTDKLLKGSDALCIDSNGDDRRENGCIKVADVAACKGPICLVGMVNMVVSIVGSSLFYCCLKKRRNHLVAEIQREEDTERDIEAAQLSNRGY